MSLARRVLQTMREPRNPGPQSVPVRSRRPVLQTVQTESPAAGTEEEEEDEPCVTAGWDVEQAFVTRAALVMDRQGEESRTGSELIHLSSMLAKDWCPRRHVLAARHGERQLKRVMAQDRIVWEMGRAAERHLRNQFIASHGRTRVVGRWQCACEALKVDGRGLSAAALRSGRHRCARCNGNPIHYGELPVTGDNLTGSPDLQFIEGASVGRHVTEIKSINKREYDLLTGPLPVHVLQLSGYVLMLRAAGVVVDTARVAYVCKDYVPPGTSPYKEYVVMRPGLELPAAQRAGIGLIQEQASALGATLRNSGPLPPRLTKCTAPTATAAKGCSQCALCFSLD